MKPSIVSAGSADLPSGFLELPALVYADDPMWVPEEPEQMSGTFSPANPWFETGESAAFCIPGKARMALFFNADMKHNEQPAAYFGYWETTGDVDADDAIFQAALDWAKDRGAKHLAGPINFTTYGNYRIRTQCEPGGIPFANEPYNPDYYEGVLERLGFTRASEAVTQITPMALANKVWEARKPAMDAMRAEGYRFERFSHQMWLDRLDELHPMIESMFSHNWGYTPLSFELFQKACGESFIRKTDPVTNVALFDPSGRLGGFFLSYPHWGPLITQGAGDARVPLSEIDYDTHWDALVATGTVIGVPKTSAILPDLQGKGLFTAMAVAISENGAGQNYSHWYGALIGADKNNRHYGAKVSNEARWYAVYARPT